MSYWNGKILIGSEKYKKQGTNDKIEDFKSQSNDRGRTL